MKLMIPVCYRYSASSFNPKPAVNILLEEYDTWCKPWKCSLIVKLLGKTVGFRTMEAWIKRVWDREGDVLILNITGDFFLSVSRMNLITDMPYLTIDEAPKTNNLCEGPRFLELE
ncbi:hypothetical protein PIB30_052048 [Stylosanthes scabra]|uniref:DUF4283 domain-containing protein n=1 Tax=Stylosanthes scabra TaxID=79078 RepID=A0ABU6UHI1_9FABA|nr:hypothetical protein [Stylosanthes scabra]